MVLSGLTDAPGQGDSTDPGPPAVGALPAVSVVFNVPPARQYDLIADLLDTDMLKFHSDIIRSEKERVQKGMTTKFVYLPMMVVATLGTLNTESFCECVLSCVK